MSDLIAELHALAQRMAAAGETDEPVTVSLAAEEIERLRGEVEKLTRRNGLIIEEAEREGQHNRQLRIERFRQFGNEDCWIYGGDDHDNLETLVCPVVMSPQHLIEILQERDQLKAEVEQLQAQLNAAKRGMDSAKAAGALMIEKGQQLAAENSPEAIESEREANAVLTAENEQLQAEVERLHNREAAMCDLHYAEGAKRGFEWGQHDDNDALSSCVEGRVPEAVKELKELRHEVEMRKLQVTGAAKVIQEEKNDNSKLREERDQLIAYQSELVRELTSCQSVLHMLAHAGEVTPAYADDAKAVLKRKSEHSLAQHDAQVIKQFVRDYTDWQGIDWMLTDFMHKRVDELSQKAKEVQS